MKKLLSAALAVLLILSLFAYGGKKKQVTQSCLSRKGLAAAQISRRIWRAVIPLTSIKCAKRNRGIILVMTHSFFMWIRKARALRFFAISRSAATVTTNVTLGLTDIASPPTTASSIITALILWRKRAATKIWAMCFALWSLTAQSTMWCSRWNLT